MQNLLAEYAKLLDDVSEKQERMREISSKIESEVLETGEIFATAGFMARMKPGRRTINHQAAVKEFGLSALVTSIIKKYTIIPPARTSWAKVTKEAKVPESLLSTHTTHAPSSFIIEDLRQK